ncbi:prepilin-type N-terminal cleavage/methylation domain-containing protein [Patescibacteria group bacterium]|nr:prepilin-type N-terminal cleavage/methylation domain-containing protein [Patescibacteria group bacterium]
MTMTSKERHENLFSWRPSAVRAGHLRGMTLIEVVVTVGIVAVITVAITQSVIVFYRANRVAFEESYQIRSAERGLQVLIRDLREATYGDNGAYPLGAIASSSITFYADVDRTNPIEQVQYRLSGQRLTRTVRSSTGNPPTYTGAVSTSTVSDYVRNFDDNISLFRYYDAAGAEVTSSAEIARVVSVSVNIIVDITPIHAPGEFTLRSGATLRNLRPQ